MTERHPPRKFADELVSQDAAISEYDFEEFRMNLEKTLESIERRARSVRRASLIASAVTIATLVLAMLLMGAGVIWVSVVLAVCFYVAFLVAGVLLTLYWHKYRPAIDRARSDLQTSMIADLQRQVAALSQRLDERAK